MRLASILLGGLLAAAPTLLLSQQIYYMNSTSSTTVGVVNIMDGTATAATSSGVGTGPMLAGTNCLAIENSSSILVFGPNGGSDGYWLMRVDRATGNRSVVSNDGAATVGTGPAFAPVGLGTFELRVLPGGTEALLVDYAKGLMKIDLTNGNRSYLSLMTEPIMSLWTDFILEAGGDVLIRDTMAGFIRVNGTTGAQSAHAPVPSLSVYYPFTQFSDTEIYFYNSSSDNVSSYNVNTGATAIVSSSSVGTGTMWSSNFLDLKYAGGRLFALSTNRVLEIDTSTGDRTVIASFPGSSSISIAAGFFGAPADMAVDLNPMSSIGEWLLY